MAWRAAVLSVDEEMNLRDRRAGWESTGWPRGAGIVTALQAFAQGTPAPTTGMLDLHAIAIGAYRRAITPASKVAPERRDRGPRIVVDNEEP